MSKIDKLLTEWQSKDLITVDQATNISAYESTKPNSLWVLYSFLMLGASIIGIGIISVVASNWQSIPDIVKLLLDLVLLSVLAVATYQAYNNEKQIIFEVLLISLMLLCLASIGLISQIYHTGGNFYQALLFWSFITAGLAACSKKFFAPFLWATLFFTGFAFTFFNSTMMKSLFENNWASVIMFLPLLSALLATGCRSVSGESGQTKAFLVWTILAGLIALFSAEIGAGFLYNQKPSDVWFKGFIPGYLIAALVAFTIFKSDEYKKLQKLSLFTSLGFYLLTFHLYNLQLRSEIIYAFCSISVLTSIAFYLASIKSRKSFQIILSLIGIRFLILYFQALGGLAYTGFGLIFSGIVIIIMVVIWHKNRNRLASWVEKLAGEDVQ